MQLTLVLLSILLPCSLASLSFQHFVEVAHGKGCPEYNDFVERVQATLERCGEPPELVAAEGCGLREDLARFADWYQCIFSNENVGWMAADEDRVIWSRIGADFQSFQVDNELDGAAEQCELVSWQIKEDRLEVATMELFDLDTSAAGEQEECWEDGIAINEVKMLAGAFCAIVKFNKAISDQC